MTQNPFDEPKEQISENAFQQLLENELERVGSGGLFVWSIFLLCVTPNILSGFHVASYTLLGHPPDDQWCEIADLKKTNWTLSEQRIIAEKGLTTKGCTILDWDYKYLSSLAFEVALNFTEEMTIINMPNEIACKEKGSFNYLAPESTFVADWELVCDREIQRTSAQMFVSLGRFFGSFCFGIFADTFGRKSAFSLGAVFFVISSSFCIFTPWYWLFLLGRFGLGATSSGLSYPAFTMLVENICHKYRSNMSIAFSASYPIGLIILAALAYMIQPWRQLQFALTVPAFLLIITCCLMKESPRWLITKKHYQRAYKILFNHKSQYEITGQTNICAADNENVKSTEIPLCQKFKSGPMHQFCSLFATWKLRRLIFTAYFMFFVSSLSYYVTALNAANFEVNRYLYVAITGIIDLPSYLIPIIMLRYLGRRITTISLFLSTGTTLLLVLIVPATATTWVMTFAMIGRLGISATYSIVPLYTAELYATEVRNSVLGTCFTWAHLGSISAPYVVDVLGLMGWYLPTTICGCSIILAALLTIGLPETAQKKLSDRVNDDIQKDTECNK